MKKSFGAVIRKECIKSFPLAPSFAAIHEALIAADPEWKDIKQSSRETYRTDCMGTLRLLEPADLRRFLALAGEEPRERSADDYNSDYGIEPSSPYDWASFYHAEPMSEPAYDCDAAQAALLARFPLGEGAAAESEPAGEHDAMIAQLLPAAGERKGKGKGKRAPISLLPAAA